MEEAFNEMHKLPAANHVVGYPLVNAFFAIVYDGLSTAQTYRYIHS